MGSGTSLLSPEDSAVLTQILKEEYDKLVAEGFGEQEIQLKLTSKYNEIIASITPSAGSTSGDGNDAGASVRGSRPGSAGSMGSDNSARRKRRTLHGEETNIDFL
jgi:hypothetical protein